MTLCNRFACQAAQYCIQPFNCDERRKLLEAVYACKAEPDFSEARFALAVWDSQNLGVRS